MMFLACRVLPAHLMHLDAFSGDDWAGVDERMGCLYWNSRWSCRMQRTAHWKTVTVVACCMLRVILPLLQLQHHCQLQRRCQLQRHCQLQRRCQLQQPCRHCQLRYPGDQFVFFRVLGLVVTFSCIAFDISCGSLLGLSFSRDCTWT